MSSKRYFRAWMDTHGGWHNADGGDDGTVYATRKEAHEASERAMARAAEGAHEANGEPIFAGEVAQ